MQIKKWWN